LSFSLRGNSRIASTVMQKTNSEEQRKQQGFRAENARPRLTNEDPTVPFCGHLGRAAARPYHIGPGRDDLPVVRVSRKGFMSRNAAQPRTPPLHCFNPNNRWCSRMV
jgi:hypothetical protein